MEDKEILEGQEEIKEEVKTVEDVETVETADIKKEEKEETKSSKSKKVKKTKKELEEEKLASYENLSDDELYAKLQTEKLLKKKKNKRLATIIGMSFAFVLAVCVIILAAVPVSLKPRCVSSDFVDAIYYPGTYSGQSYNIGEENFDDFMKYYDKSFSQSYISAIFSGSLSGYEPSEIMLTRESVVSDLMTNSTHHVRLVYSEYKTLTYQNGNVFKSGNISPNVSDRILTFNEAYFVVNDTAGVQATDVYVLARYPKTEDGKWDGVKYDERMVKITVKANTNILFKAWEDDKI